MKFISNHFFRIFGVIISIFLIQSCSDEKETHKENTDTLLVVTADSSPKENAMIDTNLAKKPIEKTLTTAQKDSIAALKQKEEEDAPLVNLEEGLQKMGLVNVQTVDPSIKIDLKYSTNDNFMKEDVYGELNHCYAQPEVAKMLAEAQKNLKKEHPDLSLIIFDAARPFRVQKKMWKIVKGTPMQDYVAAPSAKGSMHNYGAAIDLSLIDKNGKLVDMGTPYDFLGALAQPKYEEKYIKEGKLTRQQVDNRLILRKAMEDVGFKVISNEWWHFNAYPDAVTLKKFKKII